MISVRGGHSQRWTVLSSSGRRSPDIVIVSPWARREAPTWPARRSHIRGSTTIRRRTSCSCPCEPASAGRRLRFRPPRAPPKPSDHAMRVRSRWRETTGSVPVPHQARSLPGQNHPLAARPASGWCGRPAPIPPGPPTPRAPGRGRRRATGLPRGAMSPAPRRERQPRRTVTSVQNQEAGTRGLASRAAQGRRLPRQTQPTSRSSDPPSANSSVETSSPRSRHRWPARETNSTIAPGVRSGHVPSRQPPGASSAAAKVSRDPRNDQGKSWSRKAAASMVRDVTPRFWKTCRRW
jgi:hypothetical protein